MNISLTLSSTVDDVLELRWLAGVANAGLNSSEERSLLLALASKVEAITADRGSVVDEACLGAGRDDLDSNGGAAGELSVHSGEEEGPSNRNR